MKTRDIRVLLHDIRSAHNVGSIFRTSDAIGVSHVYCSGFTPTPLDRFKRPVKEIAKTALGAEKSIPWEKVSDVHEFLHEKKREGFQIVAIEQDEHAVDYCQVEAGASVIVLVGSEVDGLADNLRKVADVIAEIPMHGSKESLNVSVAFGIGMFGIFNK